MAASEEAIKPPSFRGSKATKLVRSVARASKKAQAVSEREAILELRLALGPFAIFFLSKIAKEGRKSKARADWLDQMPDEFPFEIKLTMGDFRKAVKALEETDNL